MVVKRKGKELGTVGIEGTVLGMVGSAVAGKEGVQEN